MNIKVRSLLFATLGTLVVALPVRANRLTTWQFDAQRDQLTFVTDTDVRPVAKLIANPTRLIVDLPGIRLSGPKETRTLGGKIKNVRTGQFNANTARLVVELDRAYGLDPQAIELQGTSRRNWVVKLPSPSQGDRLTGQQEIAIAVPQIPPDFLKNGGLRAVLPVGQELTWLQQRLAAIHRQYSVVNPSLFVMDLSNGNYADLRGGEAFPAASVIKLPILIAFLQDLDAGKVSMEETLVMRPELVASGSGYMQDRPNWTKFSARYTLTKMIETSDNTATNMIIKRLGGASVLNQRFRSWGLRDTAIRNWLPDLSGTNTVSAHDLSLILAKVARGNLLSAMGQKRAYYILKLTKTRSLLVPGIGPGAQIAHKTGDIGFAIGDAGIIFMPSGKQYIAAVMLKRPYNDPRGRDYIQAISRTTYAYFSQN